MQPAQSPNGYNYSGNPDFRGFVAANSPQYLGLIGNAPTTGSTFAPGNGINANALNLLGSGPGGATDDATTKQNAVNSINQLYGAYQNLNQHVLGDRTGGTTGAAGSSNLVDPSVAALLGGQIGLVNQQVGGLDQQQAIGNQNITSSYNNALNRENQSLAQAQRDYSTSRGNTIQGELSAKGQIDQGVNSNTTALQRLLGLAGSGSSSASEILAPYAADQAGNQQRQQVQTNFGQNLQGLDTSWGDTQQKHQQTLQDLQNQQFQNQQSLAGGINTQRQSLLSTLAGLTQQQAAAQGKPLSAVQAAANPIMAQIQQLVNSQAGLSSQYANPIQLQTPTAYTPPSLSSYNYDSIGGPSAQTATSATAQQTSPYVVLPGNKNLNGLPSAG